MTEPVDNDNDHRAERLLDSIDDPSDLAVAPMPSSRRSRKRCAS